MGQGYHHRYAPCQDVLCSDVLGLEAVDSYVLPANTASQKALSRVGYVNYGMRFSKLLVDGVVSHLNSMLWINPQPHRRASFWGSQPVPEAYRKRFEHGALRAEQALAWSEQNVLWL